MVPVMQSAVSALFYRQEFDAFLHAPIGGEPNEMPLSVLSGFSRLRIDPWLETAALSGLSKADAKASLATTVARLPRHRWTDADCETIAERLVELLPSPSSPKSTLPQSAFGSFFGVTPAAMRLGCVVLALIAILLWQAG